MVVMGRIYMAHGGMDMAGALDSCPPRTSSIPADVAVFKALTFWAKTKYPDCLSSATSNSSEDRSDSVAFLKAACFSPPRSSCLITLAATGSPGRWVVRRWRTVPWLRGGYSGGQVREYGIWQHHITHQTQPRKWAR